MTDQDNLELVYMRAGHISESKRIEGFRRNLFTGIGWDRKRLRQR